MDNQLIELFIELGITIAAFLVGRYVLPKIKTNINVQDLTIQFQLLLNYAESFVAYARQFLTELSGKEKMDSVVEKLQTICEKEGINVDTETLRAIGQKAYDAMVAGENSSKVVMENAVKELKAIVEPTVKEIVTETTGLLLDKITETTPTAITTNVGDEKSNVIIENPDYLNIPGSVTNIKPFEDGDIKLSLETENITEATVNEIKPE